MREGLRQALNKPHGGWVLPRPRRAALAATYDPEAKRHYFRRTWEGDEHDGIIDGLWALLENVGPERLGACAECGEPFFVRKRKEYCSLEHAQRMRNRRQAELKELKAQRLKPGRKRSA